MAVSARSDRAPSGNRGSRRLRAGGLGRNLRDAAARMSAKLGVAFGNFGGLGGKHRNLRREIAGGKLEVAQALVTFDRAAVCEDLNPLQIRLA